VEGHGRQHVLDGVDVSRTVGWFTSVSPVRIDAGSTRWDEVWAGGPALGRALKQVKEHLRKRSDGLGHGLLRHLNDETREPLAGLGGPQLRFNYLGRVEVADPSAPAADWTVAGEDGMVSGADDRLPLSHSVAVNAVATGRPEGPSLAATWIWPDGLLSEDAVHQLAESWFCALRLLVAHSRQPGAGGHTPSDLALLSLSQAEIDDLERG